MERQRKRRTAKRTGRRTAVLDWLATRCATVSQIARRFFLVPGGTVESARKRSSRFLNKQRRRGKVRKIGAVQFRDGGRPEDCYGPRTARALELEHYVLATEAEMLLGATFAFGTKAGKAFPDGTFRRNGDTFHVEICNGSATLKQLRAKWDLYGHDFDGYVLVIAMTRTRLRLLMRSAAKSPVKDKVLFARFERLASNPAPWIDLAFHRTSI